jgi:pyruvate/2-oxoglutarate dehydrogenase complex dihydrolipoamide acyltransferase (E2) component
VWISKNLKLGPALKISNWRKIALGTWQSVGDPSIYGLVELDVQPALAYIEKLRTQTEQKITLTHVLGRAVAKTIEKHPEINCLLRFGKLYPRKSIDIFFQVANDPDGKDLSGIAIPQINQKSILEICREMQTGIEAIRKKGDPGFKKMKKTAGMIPGWLTHKTLSFVGWIMYSLNIWTPLFGIPKDPFGSAMITNIGTLGLDFAYAALVPYSRVPLFVSVGAISDVPVVRSGQVVIGQICSLCITADHRLIDGMVASLMARTIKNLMADPEGQLGPLDK